MNIQPHPNQPGVFRLTAEMVVPQPIDTVFEFFSDAHNLEVLTPSSLRFDVLTPEPLDMHAGTLIDYRLRVHGIPLRWRSEITVWEPPHRFVDEQVRGPYHLWRHEHSFEPTDGGTLCRDGVDYSVPGGRVVNALLVSRDLRRIFSYRQQQLAKQFGNVETVR